MKNVSMDVSTRQAWQHIKFNMDTYGHRIREVLPGLIEHYRSLERR